MANDIGKLRKMTVDELDKEETALREEIWKLRLQRTTGQLQDHHRVRSVRKNLARVLTIKNERRPGDAAQQG